MFLSRIFVLIVGPTSESHHSFMDAYAAGIVLDFVGVSDFWKRFRAAPFHDVVVFNRRNQCKDQCRLCQQLLDQQQPVVCIGCEPDQCPRCYRPEANWLTDLRNMYGESCLRPRLNRQTAAGNNHSYPSSAEAVFNGLAQLSEAV